MLRRGFLESISAIMAPSLLRRDDRNQANESEPPFPGVVWRREFDFDVGAAVKAHGSGFVLVNSGPFQTDPEQRVLVAVVDETGAVRKIREFDPGLPKKASYSMADVSPNDDGYVVASGPWFVELDTDLSVNTTGVAPDNFANNETRVVEHSEGYAVTITDDMADHTVTRVIGFDSKGNHQWSRKYGESMKPSFLLPGRDDGVIVGGGNSPWPAAIAPDGPERWQTSFQDVPLGLSPDATWSNGNLTLFGGTSLIQLTRTRSIAWQRSFDGFQDCSYGELVQLSNGGYALAALDSRTEIRVGRTDANGQLRWSHKYTVVDEDGAYLRGFVKPAPGEYLVVGTKRRSLEGWALLLSEDETPTPTDTPTTHSRTSTDIPGFGIGAGLIGLAGGALVRMRGRTKNDEE